MTVNELAQRLNLTPITVPDGDRVVTGGYIGDLLSWVMGRAQSGDAWITIMSNINIVAVASLADTACIILAEGVTVEDNVRLTAEQKGVNLFTTALPAYETAVALSKYLQ